MMAWCLAPNSGETLHIREAAFLLRIRRYQTEISLPPPEQSDLSQILTRSAEGMQIFEVCRDDPCRWSRDMSA